MATLSIAQPFKYWIKNPISDLVFFCFGWIPVFLALVMFEQHIGLIILFVMMFTHVHRHYTFALVYGEKEEFEKRKTAYVLLPILAVIVTLVALYFDKFSILVAISVPWVMYHSVSQKYGIARIYSRKTGYGEAWIEKGLIFSWFVYLFFGLAEKEKASLLKYPAGRALMGYIENYLDYFTALSYLFLLVAAFFTLAYIYQEFRNRHQISIPKNVFVLSTLILYCIFFHSLIVGYIVFGFSHAIEYIAFVNIFVNSKYKKKPDSTSVLALASKKQWFYSSLFALAIVALCYLGMKLNMDAFTIYIVGSSFLHFIYDGFIWKIRKPEVGKPLDIKYASA